MNLSLTSGQCKLILQAFDDACDFRRVMMSSLIPAYRLSREERRYLREHATELRKLKAGETMFKRQLRKARA